MVKMERRLKTVELAMAALAVPGDFVELGSNSGGTAVLMLAALRDFGPLGRPAGTWSSRYFYAADSFRGLPEPTLEDAINVSQHRHWRRGQHRTSLSAFNANMRRNGLYDGDQNGFYVANRLRVLEGWFHETVPKAPIRRVSFLRLDGDLYASTMDGLNLLYHKVSVGGLIYADDYMAKGCRRAVDEFRERMNISTPLVKVWHERETLANGTKLPLFEAVWWQKQAADL